QIRSGDYAERKLKREREPDVKQGVGVQNERCAEGIEQVLGLERICLEVKKRILEPPVIPHIAVFVERPGRRPRNGGVELCHQRISDDQRKDEVEKQDDEVSSLHDVLLELLNS